MKIISNYSDFYDSALMYGQDDTRVFERYNSMPVRAEDSMWTKQSNPQVEEQLGRWRGNDKKLLEQIVGLSESATWQALEALYAKINDGYERKNQQVESVRLFKAVAFINSKAHYCYSLVQKQPMTSHEPFKVKVQWLHKAVSPQEALDYMKSYCCNVLNSVESDKIKKMTLQEVYKEMKNSYYYRRVGNDIGFECWDDEISKRYAPLLEQLHQDVGSPIVLFSSSSWVDVDRKTQLARKSDVVAGYDVNTMVPLRQLGFGKSLRNQVDQIYQDIDFCLHNVIKNKCEPPIALNNEQKVQQHGFDAKTSFRHPVKFKKSK